MSASRSVSRGSASSSGSRLQQRKEAMKQAYRLKTDSGHIGAIMDNLKRQLAELDKELAADKEGEKEYARMLSKLEKRKAFLEQRMAENRKWIDNFDKQIGPFEKRYEHLADSISGLYENAKEKHASALQILVDKFHYHPAFKRWDDDFTAVPFKPT
eukprot:TRINITY_DN96932_c0_g1_i1.p2 TRINITY_DN96932_c0_g1~~TRINITY_DN96932_c0_g1_i1.p2  ORF type:complete len:157 (+),score=62.65 TRINITY_DN96932_c0_g1_i1:104-574(+)